MVLLRKNWENLASRKILICEPKTEVYACLLRGRPHWLRRSLVEEVTNLGIWEMINRFG